MSKDILVNKGDSLTVIRDISKLVTNLSNGSMATWIPEDETLLVTKTIVKDGTYEASREPTKPYGYSQVTVTGVGNKIMGDLGEKSITKNGVYIAKKDKDGPFYGYSKLYVNVPGGDDGSGGDGGSSSPTITGKDADGDDAIVGTDEDGKIVTSKLPTRISINVYPNNLVYEDGQTIDFTGLRVKAFLPDDTEWGIVDDDQLIKPVTVAEYSGDAGTTGESARATSSLLPDGGYVPIYNSPVCNYELNNPRRPYAHGIGLVGVTGGLHKTSNNSYSLVLASSTREEISYFQSDLVLDYDGNASIRDTAYTLDLANPYTYNGKTVYWNYASLPSDRTIEGVHTIPTYDAPIIPYVYRDAIAWTMIYGNVEEMGSQQTIPLQWKRPGDKKVLEASFTISVHGQGDSGSGAGPAPTPSPG